MMTLLVVLAPIKAQLITALVLVIMDFLTGVWAAWKRGEQISSAGLGRTCVKVAVYEFAILAAFVAQKYLIEDALPVLSIVTTFIGISELKSVLENLSSISGVDLLRALITKLASKNDENDKQ